MKSLPRTAFDRFPRLTRFAILSMFTGVLAAGSAILLEQHSRLDKGMAHSAQDRNERGQSQIAQRIGEQGVIAVITNTEPDNHQELEQQAAATSATAEVVGGVGIGLLAAGLASGSAASAMHGRRRRHETNEGKVRRMSRLAKPETIRSSPVPVTTRQTLESLGEDLHLAVQTIAPKGTYDNDPRATLNALQREVDAIRHELELTGVIVYGADHSTPKRIAATLARPPLHELSYSAMTAPTMELGILSTPTARHTSVPVDLPLQLAYA